MKEMNGTEWCKEYLTSGQLAKIVKASEEQSIKEYCYYDAVEDDFYEMLTQDYDGDKYDLNDMKFTAVTNVIKEFGLPESRLNESEL